MVLVDDRTRLTQEGMMVGTVSYLPPEQAVGGKVTDKSDLYSLGAMLCEMATGRPPFVGDDNVAIIGQHINTPPVSPSWHTPDLPKPFTSQELEINIELALHRGGADKERQEHLEKREKLIKELQEAQAEVKALSGILPICSFCHKIRDNDDDWQSIETYIQDRSDARFSHSVCSECMSEHYPEFTEDR